MNSPAKREVSAPEHILARIPQFFAGFRTALEKGRQLEEDFVQQSLPAMRKLLVGYRKEHTKWEAAQRSVADEFNLFQVLGIEYKEFFHSKLLAWLLDPRIEHGSHAQGCLGLELLLQELQPDLDPTGRLHVIRYAGEKYCVRREVASDESRVDIEIMARGKFLIHIENKIQSSEGDNQTKREWEDLNKRADSSGIPRPNRHAIFLTLDANAAQDKNFCPVGWNRIAKVLDGFAEKAEPPVVKLFTRHYAEALRKLVAVKTGALEDTYVETTVQ